jgi:hypothetical protein
VAGEYANYKATSGNWGIIAIVNLHVFRSSCAIRSHGAHALVDWKPVLSHLGFLILTDFSFIPLCCVIPISDGVGMKYIYTY